MADDVFLSWVRFHGRSERLAELLGIEPVYVAVGRTGRRWTAPVRYVRQAVRTVRLLRRRRPDLVVAMGPPLALGVLCALVHRGALVLDAHTGAVLRKGRVRPLFLRLARHVDVVVVASEGLAARLEREHAVAAIPVHDPVPVTAGRGGQSPVDARTVVFPAGWRPDEPIDALLDAARRLPDVEIVITGRPPAGQQVPANVRLVGFVDDDEYEALLAGAGAVLALTTRSLTMQRAGYEAMAWCRPLVASDTDVLREFFTGGTVFATATGPSIAAAIAEALDRSGELAAEMADLRAHRMAEDERAIAELREAIGC